jgi:hypothetical protein
VTTRDNVLMTCGVPNGGANVALMSHMYNGISVGRMVGEHVAGDTLSAYDGPGRMKPEIVAPGGFTSFAAPVISAAAALMIETARTDPGLIGDPDAQRTEVVKAVLLGGAEHRTGWTNNPDTAGPFRGVTDRPLDPVYGVDLLDINASHLVLTGGRRTGSPSLPPQSTITPTGWSLPAIEPGGSRFYRFTLPAEADEISILATWHRRVQLLFFNWSVADIDLVLWRIGAGGELLSLVGDEGLSHFAGGNIVSESGVDNVEHLYVTGLQPGDYAVEVLRVDSLAEPTWDVAVTWLLPETAGIPGDINNDGLVNVDDLTEIIIAWGTCDGCLADVNQDGQVGVDDLTAVILNWS